MITYPIDRKFNFTSFPSAAISALAPPLAPPRPALPKLLPRSRGEAVVGVADTPTGGTALGCESVLSDSDCERALVR